MGFTTTTSKLVKIRKPHQCYGCCDKYVVGKYMYKVNHFGDGEPPNSTYWCIVCKSYYAEYMQDQDADDGIQKGEFRPEPHYQNYRKIIQLIISEF